MKPVALAESEKNKNEIHKSLEKITTIRVEEIPCYCAIGIDSNEKKTGQRLLMDVYVEVDSTKLTRSDDVNDTLSYVEIYKTVQKVAHSKPHALIELLAEEAACALLNYPLVLKVKVRVHKPHIPFPEFQGNVSVEVERTKS